MRIAHVCTDAGIPIFGTKGASIHVQETLRSFVRLGASVDCFTPRPGTAPFDLRDVRQQVLPLPGGEGPEREAAAVAGNAALCARLREAGDFDLIYERFSLWSFAAMETAARLGIPGVLEVNAPLIEEQIRHRTLYDVGSAWHAAFRAWRAARSIIAVSEGVAEYLERFEAARGKVRVVPNGVDPDRFRPAVEPALHSDRPVVGFVGSFKPWHGADLLVDAFTQIASRNPEAQLLMVGDGPERARLEREVRSRGLQSRVHFTGAVAVEEVPAWVASMDVAVAPYPEGDDYFSPLKVFEYMASGRAVVASRIGQLSSLLREGETALLVEPGRSSELATAIRSLLDDPARRARLGEAARHQVEKSHSWASVALRILEVGGLSGVPAGAAA